MDYGYDYSYGYGEYDATVYDSVNGMTTAIATTTLIIGLVVAIATLIAMIKLFKKFGKPGWAPIVPIYNMWVLLEMGGLPGWLCLIPFANGICVYIAYFQIAKKLGKSTGFCVCTIFFLPICLFIMAFDKSIPNNQEVNNNIQSMNNQGQMNNNQFAGNNQQPIQQQPMMNINSEVNAPVQQPVANTFVPSEPTVQEPMPKQEVTSVDTPQFTNVDNNNNIQ